MVGAPLTTAPPKPRDLQRDLDVIARLCWNKIKREYGDPGGGELKLTYALQDDGNVTDVLAVAHRGKLPSALNTCLETRLDKLRAPPPGNEKQFEIILRFPLERVRK